MEHLPPTAFVGRSAVRARLSTCLKEALEGRGRCVFLVGEPGIGKTRTAELACEEARARGLRVLSGEAEPGPGAPPLWPWIRVLRAWVAAATPGEIAEPSPRRAAVLARLLPELGAGSGDGIAEGELPEADTARFRLFDAVATTLRGAARETPLVVWIDDLHWADAATAELVRFLAPQLRDAPLLLLGCHREVGLPGPLAHPLAEAARHGERIELVGLAVSEVQELFAMASANVVAPERVRELHARTGGNPLFVTELLREGSRLDGDRATRTLPAGITHAIRTPLERLPAACRELLELAAVAGLELDLPLLARAGREDAAPRDLLDALEPAFEAGALRRGELALGSPPRFAHPLVRDALLDALPESRRARLHGAVGRAIEAAGDLPDDALSRLAAHLRASGTPEDLARAADYARRAGELAYARCAWSEAATQLELALASAGGERGRVRVRLAQALTRAGRDPRPILREAVEHARSSGNGTLLARAARAWPVPPVALGLSADAFEPEHRRLLEEALAEVPESERALRACLLAHLSAGSEDRLRLAEEAVALARESGERRALAVALTALHWADVAPERAERRLAVSEELVGLAEALDDLHLGFSAEAARAADHLTLARRVPADLGIERLVRIAERLREPRLRWLAGLGRGLRAWLDGDLDRAEARAREAFESGRGVARGEAMRALGVQTLQVLRERGRLADLEPMARRAAAQNADEPLAGATLAWVLAEAGRPGDARTLLATFVRRLPNLPDDGLRLPALAVLAEGALRAEARHAVSALREALRPYAGLQVVIGGVFGLGAVDRLLGLLAAAAGEHAEADAALARAIACEDAMGSVPGGARARLARARILIEGEGEGEGGGAAGRAEAAALVALARAACDAHALPALRAEAEALRERLDGAGPPPGPARPDAPGPNVFRREGDHWTLRYGGRTARVRHLRGLVDLRELLAHAGREIHVVELAVGAPDPEDAGAARELPAGADPSERSEPVLDRPAVAALRARLEDLRSERAEAERHRDVGRAERVDREIEWIAGELGAAFGLGGRPRRGPERTERMRKAVYNRIQLALRRIAAAHPDLARHLEASVRTGTLCRYAPEHPREWQVEGCDP